MALHILFTLFSLLLPLLLLLLVKSFHGKNKTATETTTTTTKQRKKNLPPGPPPCPIIGNLHQLGHLPHQSLWELSRRYGPVMLIRLGCIPTVIISSPSAAREVLRTHDLDCCSRPRLLGTGRLSYDHLDVAFTKYGDYWREMRKLCLLKLLSAKRVQSFRYVREEEVGAMIESIAKSAEGGTLVDMREKFMALTVSITCRVAFGQASPLEFNDGSFVDMIHEALAMLGSFSASDFFPRFGWIVDRFTGLHSRLEKSFRQLDNFYQKVIEEHRNTRRSKEEEEDIVDLLLKMERDQTELAGVRLKEDNIKAILMDLIRELLKCKLRPPSRIQMVSLKKLMYTSFFENHDIHGHSQDIFLAGVDTGAVAMEWTMAELARNPRAMRKAQEEIRSCIGNKERVMEDDLHGLKYLKLVLKEAMRLHPPGVLLVPRETMGHFKLFGYDVDPKTRVHVNVWAIGRDPGLWEDPEKFVPERFEDSPIDYKGNHFELLPFGAGRRVCPGISMGMAVIELALANVLHSFDWELPKGMTEGDVSMEEGAGLVVFKKVPLTLLPVKPSYKIDV